MPILYILGIIFGAGAILWLLEFLFKIASIVIVALIIGFLVYYLSTGFTQEFIHLFLLTISFFLGFSFRERVLGILSSERKQIESNKSKSKEIDKPKDFES
jgi:hypothetical protein